MGRVRVRLLSWATGMLVLFALGTAGAEHGPAGKPLLDPNLARYEPTGGVSGSLRVVGSETMQPLLNRLAGEFRRRHPDAKVIVEGGGSSTAVGAFVDKREPLAGQEPSEAPLVVASSRQLTPAEMKRFAATHRYAPTGVPIAVDAVAIYVHRDNPVMQLSLAQVDAMYSVTRMRGFPEPIARWEQVGLSGDWARASIRLYGRDEKSGTRAFVREHVLLNGDFSPAVHEEPGAASVVLAVSRDRFGVGYSGIGLQASSVHPIALADRPDMPFVTPTVETVADGSYPLRRFLYLYLDKSPSKPLDRIVAEFLAFATSREGQEAVVRAGFFPLNSQQLRQGLSALVLNGTQ